MHGLELEGLELGGYGSATAAKKSDLTQQKKHYQTQPRADQAVLLGTPWHWKIKSINARKFFLLERHNSPSSQFISIYTYMCVCICSDPG